MMYKVISFFLSDIVTKHNEAEKPQEPGGSSKFYRTVWGGVFVSPLMLLFPI